MGRLPRVVLPDLPFHVTQRGNLRSTVFLSDEDREAYLDFFHCYAEKHLLEVWAYCLMTNHVHHVVVPRATESLTRTIHDAHTKYSRYFLGRQGLRGHLWQGRFFSCPLDEVHLWKAVRYVEQNPVRAGMVEKAEDYPWSSAASHCGLWADAILSSGFPPPGVIEDWRAWLSEGLDEKGVAVLRLRTRTGRPCGSDLFLNHLETALGRVLRPKQPGPLRGRAQGSSKATKVR
ncbi:MAG: transposase [Candidatus Eisenbacteria bacterium]|nr:transposase [Candidatus Eisenbacteria bacterium]